jgi:hypothetical protein
LKKIKLNDYAEARKLLAPVWDGTASSGYHHDLDEELGCYWFNSPPPRIAHGDGWTALLDCVPSRLQSRAYWLETGTVVMDYFELQAGACYSETLRYRFIAWLERSPRERRQYEAGNDMTRAALVDWFLRVER